MQYRWSLALALMLCGRTMADTPWVALVTQVHGPVAERHGAEVKGVHVLTRLGVGDVLRVPAGSSLTIAFLQGGQRVTMTGKADGTIGDTALQGAHGTVVRLPMPGYTAAIMPEGTNLDRLGGISLSGSRRVATPRERKENLPGGGGSAHDEDTGHSAAPAPQPQGQPMPAVATVTPPLFTFTEGTSLALPPLSPGQRYTARVHGYTVTLPPDVHRVALNTLSPHGSWQPDENYVADFTASGTPGLRYVVRRLSTDARASLDRGFADAEAAWRLHPDDVGPLALMAAKFEEEGAYEPLLQRLRKLHPAGPGLDSLLSAAEEDLTTATERARQAHTQ